MDENKKRHTVCCAFLEVLNFKFKGELPDKDNKEL
jgi:hypothetical protein